VKMKVMFIFNKDVVLHSANLQLEVELSCVQVVWVLGFHHVLWDFFF
jgi:hypothetical protein